MLLLQRRHYLAPAAVVFQVFARRLDDVAQLALLVLAKVSLLGRVLVVKESLVRSQVVVGTVSLSGE